MRVLVTGSSGYIGAVLVPFMNLAGHDVDTLDIGLYSEATFRGLVPPANQRDIREMTADVFEGYDAVVALAALSNDPLGDLDPSLTYDINHRATVRTARLAKEAGVERLLFASSCSLYGAAGSSWVDESAPMEGTTPYGRSKALTERDLRDLADDAFSPTYLRNATVYGVSPALRLDIVVNNLTAWAVATKRIVLTSDGTPWRPQVHVEDVARAFVAILEADTSLVHDQAFNVGVTAENYQVREIATMVNDAIPEAILEMPQVTDADTRSYRVDFGKLADSFPGFRPAWDVPAGIRELVKAFDEVKLSKADFDRYTRLSEIRRLIGNDKLTPELKWR